MAESPFRPFGPFTESPLGTRYGGQILAQAPVQVALPFGSTVKRYSVMPLAVVRTVPTELMVVVPTLTEPPEAAPATPATPANPATPSAAPASAKEAFRREVPARICMSPLSVGPLGPSVMHRLLEDYGPGRREDCGGTDAAT